MCRAFVCSSCSLMFLLGLASGAQNPKPAKPPMVFLGEISGDPLPAPALAPARPKTLVRIPQAPAAESTPQAQQQAKETLRIAGIKWVGTAPVVEPPITFSGARMGIKGRGWVNAVNIEQVETYEDGTSRIHLGKSDCYLDVTVATTPGSAYLFIVEGEPAGDPGGPGGDKPVWVLQHMDQKTTFGPTLGGFETAFVARDRRVELRLSVDGLQKRQDPGHVYSIRIEKVQ